MKALADRKILITLLKSWCLRLALAGVPLMLMGILWKEQRLLLGWLRDDLAAIAVSILIYPAFAKVIRLFSMTKTRIPMACLLAISPFLLSCFVSRTLYQQQFIQAASLFLIVLFLLVLWFLIEVVIDQNKPPEKGDSQEQSDNCQRMQRHQKSLHF